MVKGFKLCLLVIIASLLGACQQEEKPKPVTRGVYAMEVKLASSMPTRAFPGKAKAVEEANLSFDVSGTLSKLPIKVGDEVKKGQVLAQLDKRNFTAKLNSAKAELERSSKNLKRAKNLVAQDFISQAEYDRIVAAVTVATSNVDLAQKALEDTTIIAPFDGVITKTYVENFEAIKPKQVIARILDISEIEMIVQIPEHGISRLRQVKAIEVLFDAYPDTPLMAKIKEIGKEATQTTRTYPITLIMDQPKSFKILPGMAGMAQAKTLSKGESQSTFILPISAVFTPNDEKKDYVWVLNKEKNKVSKVAVKVDQISAQGAYIQSGIKAGDWVVTAGANSLHQDQQVRLLQGGQR